MKMPSLGLGTWRMGESRARRTAEVAAVRTALELGYRLIDTAEMYGEGGAESVIGQALADLAPARASLTLVSKVYPHNASRRGVVSACEASLKRLGVDYLDCYLLHWRGNHPLAETLAGFERLREQGKILRWGVSNFDVADMNELFSIEGGGQCAVNQVYYSAGQRGVEFDLLPWQQSRGVLLMAYSPIDQGALADHPVLQQIGARHAATASQVALAWLLTRPGVCVIPKAVSADHLRENLAAPDLVLDEPDLRAIEAAFAPPRRKQRLAML